ncbi:hypothetical protein BDB00DRAFT_980427 [Zychaea mexicana]|uniref:uncharacterized protein n=1 Tax=Zychaea mexicana TaxID=64656 RepID=UPI0022FE5142|nr:uncharacterized protein BDB00DRAFT_980427 [Zychaea mexicana]KAI9489899.1 hypothetical protein BDB00DRAFT_980427 [Zychaea mexicana]
MQREFSIEVTHEPVAGETPIRRSILAPFELMTSPATGVDTLYDVLQYAASSYKHRHAFGYRKLEQTFVEEKEVPGSEKPKQWKYHQFSNYHYYSYIEAVNLTRMLGAGLRKLGMKKGDKLHIFASTSVEWMLMTHGAFTQSISIVTAYDTLGPEGLMHSINETGSAVCFINGDQLEVLEKIIGDCPSITHIIYRDVEVNKDAVERLRNIPQIHHVIPFEEVRIIGEANPVEPVKPTSQDISCIMYTSGTTGNPKGVVLTHGNIVAAIAGCCKMLQHLVEANDTMMAYLPLAHVLEFLVENLCIFLGLTLGYGGVKTLTDVSVRNCRGDLFTFAPTIMCGVPQVWETIRKTVLAKIAERGPRIEKIFMGALTMKDYLKSYGLPTGVLDKIVFKKVKEQLGGKLRYGLSGGAPLSVETQRFLSLSLAPIICGYGMTERCSMCAVMAPEQFALGEAGAPVPCTEVKLVDVPELNYFASNNQGEILIRGPSVTSGYYKQEELTREALTPDGWLMTGDIGQWNAAGTLSIIDRKKNLVKLSHGEYIALEKVESVYKSCPLIENLCVHADPLYPRPVALVVPLEHKLREFAAANGIENDDYSALCADTRLRKLVLGLLQEQAKNNNLKGAEVVQNVWICKDLWTSDMGLLTAAQKLKRKEITEAYSEKLKQMVSSLVK